MDDLKVLMIPTTNAGVAFWRMFNFWVGAFRTRAMDVHMPFWKWDMPEANPWETMIAEPQYKSMITNELTTKVRQADVVVMQLAHFPDSLMTFAGIKEMFPGTPVVAEVDDNYISTASYNPAFQAYEPGRPLRDIANKQFQIADALIVSTPYLKDVYAELNDNIHVVPNCIDLKRWDVKARNKPGIRIGWAGGASHYEDLKLLEPIIHATLKKHKGVKFVFLHGIPEFLKNIPDVECVYRFERIDKYPRYLAANDFDIGLAPLIDNAFNRGKSNLRWLEYSALGIPTVASNVGHFKETINHGVDGFLADSKEDFQNYLDHLITNRKERIAVGLRAKERIASDFNVDKWAFHYADILKEIVKKGQVKKDVDMILYGKQNKDFKEAVEAGHAIGESAEVLQ